MSEVRESEYNGKPLLGIFKDKDDNFGFKFGLQKAQRILKHVDEIKAFVEKHAKTTADVGHAPNVNRDLGA